MSPLLTTYANGSARGYGAFSVVAAAGDFESIATVTVGSGGASDVTFSSISSTYTHLQIRFINLQSATGSVYLQFNSDTSGNYSWHELYGDGSTVTAYADVNQSFIKVGYTTSTTASYASGSIVDILDYANTNKYKTVRALMGSDANGSGLILFRSGSWRNTNAVTSIKIYPVSGNFNQYSHFALYGIKSA